MKNIRIHIVWLWSSILLMLLTACSSSSDNEEGQLLEAAKHTMLTIYLYSPDQPIVTRADVGPVTASEAENKVNSIQLWVFDTSGNKIGYLSTTETASLNYGQGAVYQIPVSDEFALNRPNVDVYVLANVTATNCGITTTLDENTTREQLIEQAKITVNHYGVTAGSLTTTVPDEGLPMAGMLTDQHVTGDAPVLRIGTTGNITTVPLTRAVSKLRFFFANNDVEGAPELTITGIALNGSLIPNEEYLFPNSLSLNYDPNAASILENAITVQKKENPDQYVYDGKTAQEYENLMMGAGLSQAGPYYLRESGKLVEGTITYTIEGNPDTQTANFKLQQAGDFSRNHIWIVYAYYAVSGNLQVQSLYVKDWSTKEINYKYFNW